MKAGAWHQFGDRSQKLALEQLSKGNGVGVILSPRDLAAPLVRRYAPQYQAQNADILIDPQFHIPHTTVGRLETYGINSYRMSVDALKVVSDQDLDGLARALRTLNADVDASGVIAPAVVYEPGRSDIVDLNRKLFGAARRVGNDLGIPVYGTIVIARSALAAEQPFLDLLSLASSVQADGWYYAVQFTDARVPNIEEEVLRCLVGGLTLVCTELPVLHAFTGPMSILAMAYGATGAGIGHSQNLWKFSPGRWAPGGGGGGGGDAPPRYFSKALWATIVYPDEWAVLSNEMRAQLETRTPYSTEVTTSAPFLPWARWAAGKHLVHAVGQTTSEFAAIPGIPDRLDAVETLLEQAAAVHAEISQLPLQLRDDTASYQEPWLEAVRRLRTERVEDIEFLELLQ